MTTADVPALTVAEVRDVAWGWLAVPGIASIGAGAIHAAAIGAHSEHRQAVVTFALLAAFQVGWGALALTRTNPFVVLTGLAGNLAAFAGWVLAKASGISFITGLDVKEKIQLADAAAAALALAAVVLAAGGWLAARRSDRAPASKVGRVLVAGAVVAVTSLTFPAMVSAGSHHHAEGEAGHTHGATTLAAGHTQAGGAAAAVPVKPYDPTQPIDLSGVPGVTPEQQARAENLIAVTLLRLPKFSDPAVAEAAGYRSIGDAGTGFEHYINWSYIDDDKTLDPDFAESLVYRAYPGGRRELQAAMFMLTSKDTLETVPDVGGSLTQWHIHNNLCFTDEPGDYKVRGLTNAAGTCTPPLVQPTLAPMLHVWTVKQRCGPFAALDGIGAGQIKVDQTRLCDHVHGSA